MNDVQNTVEPVMPQMTIWCMPLVCRITKASHTLTISSCNNDCTNAPKCYANMYIVSLVYIYYKWATEGMRCWKLKTACLSYSPSSDKSICSAEIVLRSLRSAEKWICYHEHSLLSKLGRSPSTTWPACVIQECQLSFPYLSSLPYWFTYWISAVIFFIKFQGTWGLCSYCSRRCISF